ncbi:hypothetical protein F2Q69_00023656 [Brassica cretica]|uniref:Uncharacterized protein n=1 Tax=Brassica cretica TaxID=69181 RepID=A0A8S9QSX6_BRACR|nr:hypothetical protein F2Q69_00023656 [Brassica cretica]
MVSRVCLSGEGRKAIFSAGRYRTSVIRRENGAFRVTVRTRSINGAEVGPSSIMSFMSRNDCLSSASSWTVSNSCFRIVVAGSAEFPAKGAKIAAIAASCSFVVFGMAYCCAILSSMVSANASAIGAPSVVDDSSSGGESDRAMIFLLALLCLPHGGRQLFELRSVDKLVKRERRVLVGGSRQRRVLLDQRVEMVLQKGEKNDEISSAKAGSSDRTSLAGPLRRLGQDVGPLTRVIESTTSGFRFVGLKQSRVEPVASSRVKPSLFVVIRCLEQLSCRPFGRVRPIPNKESLMEYPIKESTE